MTDIGKMFKFLSDNSDKNERGCADGFCEPVQEDVPFESSFRINMKVGKSPEHGFVLDATVLKGDPETARIWFGYDDEPSDFYFTADEQTLTSLGGVLANVAQAIRSSRGDEK